jgi:hypothetical protein
MLTAVVVFKELRDGFHGRTVVEVTLLGRASALPADAPSASVST